MRTLVFADWPTYPLVFLVPQIRKSEIEKEYLTPFGIPTDDVKVIGLHYSQSKKKTPARERQEFIQEKLVQALVDCQAQYLIVADPDYFKDLTGAAKAEVNIGYVLDCKPCYGPWKVIYVPNYRGIYRNPDTIRRKIGISLQALISHIDGTYKEPGEGIIHFQAYPTQPDEIQEWLDRLLEMDCDLSIDIEAFSLKHYEAGIGTISFAWSKHEGIAFPVDYVPIPGATQAPFGKQVRNDVVRGMLKNFFIKFLRKSIYHNISYDVTVLIFQLFMDDLLDTEGLLEGMDVMLRNWDCTKLITYLATNSCAGNELSLKEQAQEFAGNYAQSGIEDITRIPLADLLQYNLIDALSTWFVKEKHEPTLDTDEQREIYEGLFKDAILDIVQMQLTGLPVNMKKVEHAEKVLISDHKQALDNLLQNFHVKEYVYLRNEDWVRKKNATLKKKKVTMADAKETFNPNSDKQLRELLYEHLKLPILSYTDSRQPSTDAKALKGLKKQTQDPQILDLLENLIDHAAATTILNTFIPALKGAAKGPDDWHYLFGNFNLGGTVSGRLSSNKPNLQNLPSTGTKYAALIKECFEAPPGWIFAGLDFWSLEDRISGLTTKDPNKLKVYIDGFDGHCLRAYAYFGDEMPDIDPHSVDSINSIETKYPDLRQKSKTPTFALTYQGTYKTLMEQGFTYEEAKKIEASYNELYKVSIQWVQDKLNQAARDGYITIAFGLRLRTPILAQVVRGLSVTPYEAEAEGRTAGNALGQSWCMLNTRAGSEFMGKVRKSEYRLDIRPCAQIHDAQYYLIRDNIDILLWANEHLVKAAQWQEHPDIKHDKVGLGGNLAIYWPNWANEIKIPNDVTEAELLETVEAGQQKWWEKQNEEASKAAH